MIKLPTIKQIYDSLTPDESAELLAMVKDSVLMGYGDDGMVDYLATSFMDLDFIPYAHRDIAYHVVHVEMKGRANE